MVLTHNRRSKLCLKGSKHLDVAWYLPKRKRPFTYSTQVASDLLVELSKMTKNHTPIEILPLITYDVEAREIMQAYIDKGYGNESLNIK